MTETNDQANNAIESSTLLGEPKAWMRRWAFDGEEPEKVKKENGRWAWPHKFKLKEVTLNKCLPDDVPLYAPNDLNQVEQNNKETKG